MMPSSLTTGRYRGFLPAKAGGAVLLAFVAGCIACVLVSRKQYAAGARKQDECMLQIAELARSVVDLESSRRGIEEVSDRGISLHAGRRQFNSSNRE